MGGKKTEVWDFSGDEFAFFGLAVLFGGFGLLGWYYALLRIRRPKVPGVFLQRFVLAGVPPLALGLLWVVLQRWGDPVFVAGHVDYLLLFMAGGAMWMGLSVGVGFPLAGLFVREDALERANPAAVAGSVGAILAVILTYAGGNIGNGPTIWTTLVPAFLATVALFVVWIVLELLGGARESVAVERDVAAGVRLAGFLVAVGLILGRAAASDWETWAGTFDDLCRLGWPALLLVIPAAVLNRLFAPTPRRPHAPVGRYGIYPAMAFVALAAIYVIALGAPKVAPPGHYALAKEVHAQ